MMGKWKSISVPVADIETYGNYATIEMPADCGYKGYKFRHPIKLLKKIDNKNMELIYSDDFIFRLCKKGGGKYNKNKIIGRYELSANTITNFFDEFQRRHVPEIMEPEKAIVPEELLDE